MINFLEITKECEAILSVLYFARELLKIICILIPIGLIVMLSIDIAKGIIFEKEKGNKVIGIVTKRLIYAVVIFLLPETIFGLFNIILSNQTDESYACYKYAGEVSVEDVRELLKAQEEALEKQTKELDEERVRNVRERVDSISSFQNTVLVLSNSKNNSSEGTFMGQTYDLTDVELRGIANVCQHEQGTPEGAAAEASLMANRFELFGVPYANLFKYVENSGWWGKERAKEHINNPSGAREEIVDAVKEVLVHGKRTLPLYVDEHDCIWCGDDYGFNVSYIDNNGEIITNADYDAILDHSNYHEGITKIYNTFDSVYTFHSFISDAKYADPFGYTETAMNKYKALQE